MTRLWNKKIPTFVGILLITVGVLTTSYLVHIGVTLFSGAAPSDNPMDVRVTNITDQSFSVTYTTQTPVIGTVSVGTAKDLPAGRQDNLQVVLDDRDQQSGTPNEYSVHSITINKLQPDTPYVFSITSGSTTYLNHGNLFAAATAPTISTSPSTQTPLNGKVVESSGTPPKEALIYVTTTNGQLFSTLTKQDGIFIFPLNNMRTTNLKDIVTFTPDSQLQIIATDAVNTTKAKVAIKDTNPLPMLTLGSSYDFTTSTTPVASTTASLGFPAFTTDSSLDATPVITTPKKDETFSDQQPQFNGKGLPNQKVTIEIHSSNVITATVTTNANGTWTYRPDSPLSPGDHTISITTKNAAGILQTIEQSFTVYASGSQVDESATPSATLAPTATPTPSSTPLPTHITPPPTLSPSPTMTHVVVKTQVTSTPKSQLPPTGSNTLVITASIGLVTTISGIVLYIVSLGVL